MAKRDYTLLQVWLPRPVHDRLKELAELHYKSKAQVIRDLLVEWFTAIATDKQALHKPNPGDDWN